MFGKHLNNVLFRWFSYLFSGLEGKIGTQKFFKALYHMALDGMNYGKVHNFKTDGEQWLLKSLAPELRSQTGKLTIFDVGANRGTYTEQILEIFKESAVDIHLFEPGSASFHDLETRFRDKKVVLNHFGLGESRQQAVLYVPDQERNCASIHYQADGSCEEMVELYTIDDYCRSKNITHIHLLKLDVEGHEFACLKGAHQMLRNNKVDLIQFEFGNHHIYSRVFFRDIFDYLEAFGYSVYRLLKNGLAPVEKYHPSLEVFITSNYVARITPK